MNKSIEKGSEEWSAFTDIWDLYQAIGGVEDNDNYWSDAVDKINEYAKKHDTVLGRELALAIMGVITQESKEQRYSRLITFIGYAAMEDKKISNDLARQAVLCASHWIKEDEK